MTFLYLQCFFYYVTQQNMFIQDSARGQELVMLPHV